MISTQSLIELMQVCDPNDCPYLAGRTETIKAIRCPGLPNALHSDLIELGFRHSNDIFYTTVCENCNQCIPIRIDPAQFRPSKKQRHVFNKNKDIDVFVGPVQPNAEKHDIYQRYMALQHGDSHQDTSYETLKSIFSNVLPSTVEIQYRLGTKLVGVTIADIIPRKALSSVYHIFDPDYASRSIGVFSMLAEIKLTQVLEIPYFYPGLWIPECKKMSYKAQYKPNQILVNGEWKDNDLCYN